MTVFGYDCSSHDWDRHPVSLANARAAGISLMTHKATEGHTYTDPRFDDFCRQNPGRFPVAGSYCAAWPNDPKQADHWYATVERYYPAWRDHPCWIWQIDAEPWKRAPRAISKAEIERLGARIEKLARVDAARIIVYAPKWHYGDSLRGIPYRLWASGYGDNPAKHYRSAYPGDQSSGWDEYSGQVPIILQYGSRAVIGAQHTCDASAIRVKNESELQALFGGNDMTPDECRAVVRDEINRVLHDSDGNPVSVRTLIYNGINRVLHGADDKPHSVNTLVWQNVEGVTKLAADVDQRIAALQKAHADDTAALTAAITALSAQVKALGEAHTAQVSIPPQDVTVHIEEKAQ